MGSPLSAEQMAAFERDGAVLVDTPLTLAEMDGAEAAWHRIRGKETTTSTDTDFLNMLTHPFFESVAQQVLRATGVQVLETYPHDRPPSTDLDPAESRETRDFRTWNGGHVDVQITRSDWDSTPRREMLAIWYWCNDVPIERGPMRVLLGSHLPLADHWQQKIQDPAKLAQLPRVHGMRPIHPSQAEMPAGSGGTFQCLPEMSDVAWRDQQPWKAVAKRGQALVFSQALLHQATANEDTESRKGHIMSWTADTVPGFLATGRIDGMRSYHATIRQALAVNYPERAHIVPQDFMHAVSEYGNAPELGGEYWEEMFLPLPPVAAAESHPKL
jgi:hypothetical protein